MRPILTLLLLAAPPALAEELRLLTYDDALRSASEANPALQRAEITARQSEEDVRAAHGGFDPTLSVNGGYEASQSLSFQPPFPDPFTSKNTRWNVGTTLAATAPTGTSVRFDASMLQFKNEIELSAGNFEQRFYQPSFRLSVSQELLRGIALAFNLQNIRQAAGNLTIAELQIEAARQTALADTARAYWAWVYAVRLTEIQQAAVDAAAEALRIGEARVAQGQVAPLERTRLEAALVQARSALIEAAATAEQSADSLLLLMGEKPGSDVRPGTPMGDAPPYTLDPDKAVDVALAQSLDVALARARGDLARVSLVSRRHAMLPSLTATVDGGFTGGNDTSWANAYSQLGGFPTIGVSGVFSVPLGNRAALAQARRASAEVAMADASTAETERSVAAQVEQQVRVLSSARLKIELADVNLRLAEETLAAEEALHTGGRTLLTNVLDARTQLARTQAEAAKARADARVAEVELLRLQGAFGR